MPKSARFGRRVAQTRVITAERPKEQTSALPRLPRYFALPTTGPLARVPFFSLGFFAVLAAVFQIELSVAPYSAGGTPSLSTLVAIGGVSRTLVLSGEWW